MRWWVMRSPNAPRSAEAPIASSPTSTKIARARRPPALLEREVPGQFKIVAHDRDDLARQVLFDLPDFDSHYAGHLEITRRMLRRMLYPIWLLGVRNIADRRPQSCFRKVSAGNDPGNLIFCLNKVDQLEAAGEWGAARTGFAHRLRRSRAPHAGTGRTAPRLIIALLAQITQLPACADMLNRPPSRSSPRRAEWPPAAQVGSLIAWVRARRLRWRLDRVSALESQAPEEPFTSTVAGPVLGACCPPSSRTASILGHRRDEMRSRRARPLAGAQHAAPAAQTHCRRLAGRVVPTVAFLATSTPRWWKPISDDCRSRSRSRCRPDSPSCSRAAPLVSPSYTDGRLWETMRRRTGRRPPRATGPRARCPH